MPLELFDIFKIIIGLIILTIPGYLWINIFFKNITLFEKIIFSFVISLGFLTTSAYILNIYFNILFDATLIFILFLVFTLPIVLYYVYSIYKFGLPKIRIYR